MSLLENYELLGGNSYTTLHQDTVHHTSVDRFPKNTTPCQFIFLKHRSYIQFKLKLN